MQKDYVIAKAAKTFQLLGAYKVQDQSDLQYCPTFSKLASLFNLVARFASYLPEPSRKIVHMPVERVVHFSSTHSVETVY